VSIAVRSACFRQTYSITGLPVFANLSISSTVPEALSGVAVPSLVQKMPNKTSLLSTNCRFRIA
jgi:hypothetical protein